MKRMKPRRIRNYTGFAATWHALLGRTHLKVPIVKGSRAVVVQFRHSAKPPKRFPWGSAFHIRRCDDSLGWML